jgi:hypothetical protein
VDLVVFDGLFIVVRPFVVRYFELFDADDNFSAIDPKSPQNPNLGS